MNEPQMFTKQLIIIRNATKPQNIWVYYFGKFVFEANE